MKNITSRFTLEKKGICGSCGEDVGNGVGAKGSVLTPILNNLPSSHIFREPANAHDVFYHIGKTEGERKIADKVFLAKMLDRVRHFPVIKKQWYIINAYRNYYAVRLFGKRFFNWKGCKGNVK